MPNSAIIPSHPAEALNPTHNLGDSLVQLAFKRVRFGGPCSAHYFLKIRENNGHPIDVRDVIPFQTLIAARYVTFSEIAHPILRMPLTSP